ncbi:hypothetical protein EJB05_27445, partial [Eragrostis curvula]
MPPPLRQLAELVAGLLAAGGAWALRVAAALRDAILDLLTRQAAGVVAQAPPRAGLVGGGLEAGDAPGAQHHADLVFEEAPPAAPSVHHAATSSALNGAADLDPSNAAPPAGILPIDAARAHHRTDLVVFEEAPPAALGPDAATSTALRRSLSAPLAGLVGGGLDASNRSSSAGRRSTSAPRWPLDAAHPAISGDRRPARVPSSSSATSLGADEAGLVEGSSSPDCDPAARPQDSAQGRILGADAVAAGGDPAATGLRSAPPPSSSPPTGATEPEDGAFVVSAAASSSSFPQVTPAARALGDLAAGGANQAGRGGKGGGRRAKPGRANKAKKVNGTSEVDFLDWEGFGLGLLFGKESEVDEIAMKYAVYCWTRSKRLDNKNFELCDICYFKEGKAVPIQKEKMKHHTQDIHKQSFPCEKKGCFVRCASRGEAGLHQLYVHEQKSKDWWRELLERQGFKMM